MLEVTGFAQTSSDGREIKANFWIDSIGHQYVGTLSQGIVVPSFSSLDAVLGYNDPSNLSGSMSFSGNVGPSSFSLCLSNKYPIKGDLSESVVAQMEVRGSGKWSQISSPGSARTIKRKIHVDFNFDNIKYHLIVEPLPRVPEMPLTNARVTRANLDALEGTHTFEGTYGPETVVLRVSGGLEVIATLEKPVPAGLEISGTGVLTRDD